MSAAPCVGPLLYRNNATGVSVTRNCTSSGKVNTTDVWFPNATYMQLRHGLWDVETVLNDECVPVGRPNVFGKADCSLLTFDLFTDANCTLVQSPNNSSNLSGSDQRTCFIPSTTQTDAITFPPHEVALPSSTTAAPLTTVVSSPTTTTGFPTTSLPVDTITAPPTTQPVTPSTSINSNTPAPTSAKPSGTTSPPSTSSESTKKPAASPTTLSSTSMASSFVWTAIGVAILVVVYRKLRRRNNYIQLRNPGSP